MNNEIERMRQIVGISADFAEVERLRLAEIGICLKIAGADEQLRVLVGVSAALEAEYAENQERLRAATARIHGMFSVFSPVPAKVRGAATKEEVVVGNKPELSLTDQKVERNLAILLDPNADPCAKCHASSACGDCCRNCISPCDTKQQICRKHEKPLPGTERPAGIEEIEAKMAAETTRRDGLCDKWRGCFHSQKCFDPKKAALQGTYCLPAKQEGSEPLATCINLECDNYDASEPNGCSTLEHVRVCDAVEMEGVRKEPRHDALTAERKAAGDDINDSGVFLNPEILYIPFLSKFKRTAQIEIAEDADGFFHMGYEFKKKDLGSSGVPSISGTAHPSRKEAILEAVALLKSRWPEAWTEAKLKSIRENVADFVKAFDPPTPTPVKEEPKQELAQPANESPAQASEVVRCRNNACDYFDSFLPDNCSRLAIGEPEPVTACKNYRADSTQQETPNATQQEAPTSGADGDGSAVMPAPASIVEDLGKAPLAPVNFNPLDEPLGDCELCQGFGVIDGEMYGEFALIPCSCEAGKRVNGTENPETPKHDLVLKACCNDCKIEDPDCHSCDLPNEKPDIPKCANGSCTATGKNAKEICLRIGQLGRAPKDCQNFVPVENCNHHMLKRTHNPDGSNTCDLCGFLLRPADPLPAKPELTSLQQKCTHPKIFRILTVEGETCKVCKFVLGGWQGLLAL